MTKDEDCCLKAKHYETQEMVYFLESVRAFKAAYRPELRDNTGSFIQERVKETIESPHFVYEDYRLPQARRCLYRLEYSVDGKNWYVKVVLEYVEIEKCFKVTTTFRSNAVKERGKTKLIYGQDN
jgi:hypothetical protein